MEEFTQVFATLDAQQYDALSQMLALQLGLQSIILGAMLTGFAIFIWAVIRK